MYLYISGETSGESRFSNLQTGSKSLYYDMQLISCPKDPIWQLFRS